MTIEALIVLALVAAAIFGILWAVVEGGDKVATSMSRRKHRR
ncbi:hypothetical protein [Pseudorhodoplanes sp.]